MSIFREYDIRGIFGKELKENNVTKIGLAIGKRLKDRKVAKVAIGYDARVHSKDLFRYLSDGLMTNGIDVYNLGLVPTPVAYFACFRGKVSSSIMITGSHNPPEYNGFKITIERAPFYGAEIQALGKELGDVGKGETNCGGMLSSLESREVHTRGKLHDYTDILMDYKEFLISEFRGLQILQETIAFDCGNGVAGVGLMPVLDELGIRHRSIYTEPDGNFPNHHPDPSEPSNLSDLKKLMLEQNIKVGIAFDGDADRVALISRDHMFRGDELAILFARDIAKDVPNPTVIGEVKCSMNMYDEINKVGRGIMCKTGHSNIKVKLKELGASLACEMSGHIFFNDRYFGYDDAIYASLRILEMVLERGIDSMQSEIQSLPRLFSTDEEKIPSSDRTKFETVKNLEHTLRGIQEKSDANFPNIKEIINIDGVRVVFENGWGLVRASNTMPVLVTRFEATNETDLGIYKRKLLEIIDRSQG